MTFNRGTVPMAMRGSSSENAVYLSGTKNRSMNNTAAPFTAAASPPSGHTKKEKRKKIKRDLKNEILSNSR